MVKSRLTDFFIQEREMHFLITLLNVIFIKYVVDTPKTAMKRRYWGDFPIVIEVMEFHRLGS